MAERSMKQQQARAAADRLVHPRRARRRRWRSRADREGEGLARCRHHQRSRVRPAEGQGARVAPGTHGARRVPRESPVARSTSRRRGGRRCRRRPRARRTSSSCCSTTSATRSSAATARHRDADVRPPRRGRAALPQLPHHGAVLADARLPAHRAQPPPQRDGAHRRVRVGLPRLRRDDAEGERLPVRDPRAQRLRDVRRRQVAPRARGHDGRRRAPRPLATRSRVRAVLRLPRRRDRPVPPRPRARQPPDRPAAHARGGLPPHRGPGRHGAAYLTDLRAASPTKPFFLCFAPGACHAPHQVPDAYIDQYAGASTTAGTRGARRCSPQQVATGLLPAGHRAERAAAAGSPRGTRSPTTSAGCTRG